MKKLLLFALFFGFYSKAEATHIIGGSFSYSALGFEEYEIRLEVYRDCYSGVPWFDSPAYVGIFDANWNYLDNLYVDIDPTANDTLNLVNAPICFPPVSAICVHRMTYKAQVHLPPIPGGYRLLYQRCCRSQFVSNLYSPLSQGISIVGEIPETPQNSSAQLKNALPYYGFVHQPWVYDASATDADGDSLVYRLTRPLAGGDTINPQPLPTDPLSITPLEYVHGIGQIFGPSTFPLEMNPKTGELKALPALMGFFVIAFEVEEWRKGQFLSKNHHEIAVGFLDGKYQLSADGFVAEPKSGQRLDQGRVEMIRRNPLTNELILIASDDIAPSNNGRWRMDDIYSSKYLFRAFPDPTSTFFASTFPTYADSSLFWYDAHEYEICSASVFNIPIFLRTDSMFALGNGSFSGKVVHDSMETPVADLELWLMKDQNTPVAWTKTDAAGAFSFKNLADGHYFLFINKLNSPNHNEHAPEIEVAPQHEGKTWKINYTAPTLTLDGIIGAVEAGSFERVKISPNPAFDLVNIAWPEAATERRATLVGPSGQVFTETRGSAISVKNLPPGIYFLLLETDRGRWVERLAKH